MLKDAASSKEELSHGISANRFGALDVEDLDECLNVATLTEIIQTKKLAKDHDIDVHEPEGLYEIDHASKSSAFLITCIDCRMNGERHGKAMRQLYAT